MEFLHSFFRRHFAGKLAMASRNVGCFLRLDPLFPLQWFTYKYSRMTYIVTETKPVYHNWNKEVYFSETAATKNYPLVAD